MQPNGPLLQKLAELPPLALEALLDSDDIKVASENTAIAVVGYWLSQEDRRHTTSRGQQLRLAYKLRLLRATRWYLTRMFADQEHWLAQVLSGEQRIMLTAAAQNKRDWEIMERIPENSLRINLAGEGEVSQVSWSKRRRPTSAKVAEAEVVVEVGLQQLWDKRDVQGTKYGTECLNTTACYGLSGCA